jgi:Fe-S-cluster containining protein
MPQLTIQITLNGRPLSLSLNARRGKVALDGMLDTFHQLADRVIADAINNSKEPVSCAKGCDACCRQLVPIAPMEARGLARVVDEMPAGPKEKILSRFERNLAKLRESSVYDDLMDRLSWPKGMARQTGLRYLELNLSCPFLENGACGIYEHRPAACREYLVTSNPVHCQTPDAKTIRPVEIPGGALWAKLSRLELEKGEKLNWIPLIFCLMETLPPPLAEMDAPHWINQMLK